MTTLRSYPWTRLKKGQGFFVPALDLDAAREAGLRAAVRAKVTDAKTLYCIREEQLGVLFYRPLLAPKKQS